MKTTLNIHTEIIEKISKAAHIRGISRSEMIIILIKQSMNHISNPGRLGSLVRYQKKSMAANWHKFHIRLRIDDYEYFLDLRKLLKMSVSLILEQAVHKFLPKLLKQNDRDNYQHKNYIIVPEIVDDIISWRFIWGYPIHIKKLFSYRC